jgi:hypothetical protein
VWEDDAGDAGDDVYVDDGLDHNDNFVDLKVISNVSFLFF